MKPPASPLAHKIADRARRRVDGRKGELDRMLWALIVIVAIGGYAILTWGGR